jgi:monovalent cation:H+ antiporter-2, CPA2 family
VQDQRDARYNLLRGYFHGQDDDTSDDIDHERLHTVTLPPTARTVGQPLERLALHAVGVRVVNLRRFDGQTCVVNETTSLQANDVIVINGTPQALALAEEKLLRG